MAAAWLIWISLIGAVPNPGAEEPAPGQPRIATSSVASTGPGPARTATSSAAAPALDDADPFEDLPLSPEELALIEALDTATAAQARRPPMWGSPPDARGRRTMRAERLHETGARTTQAALRGLPALAGRWRWGADSPVLLDGLLIGAPRMRTVWLRGHPGRVGRLTLAADADRGLTSEDLGGSIRLAGPQAALSSGLVSEVELGLRTADRGVGAAGTLGWGGRAFAVRLFVAGQHEDDLRVRREDGTAALAEQGFRGDLGLHARARPAEWLDLDAQAGFTAEDGQSSLQRHDQRMGLYARLGAHVGTASAGVALSGGYLEARLGGPTGADRGGQGHLRAHWRPLDALELEAGGFGAVDRSSENGVDLGHRLHLAGFGFATLDVGRWFLRAGARLAHLETHDAQAKVEGVTSLLPQADLQVLAFGDPEAETSEVGRGLALRLHAAQGLDVPGPWDLERLRVRGPARTWRFAGGPALRLDDLWLDARFVFLRHDQTIRTDVLGFEVDGGARLLEGLHAEFALAWLEGASLETLQARYATPNLRGHLALRYRMVPRRIFVEVRARYAGPRWAVRSADGPPTDPAYGFVRVGLAGGLDLGAGLRLQVTVENALDRRTRDLATSEDAPGLDLRARLSWTP